MKRFLSVLVVSATLSLPSMAQTMMSYDATVVKGTYEEMTGGTVVPLNGMTTKLDTAVFDKSNTAHVEAFEAEGYPIGFDFKYDNKLMNQFAIGGRGYLVLGKDIVKASCDDNPYMFFTDGENEDALGVFYRSGIAAIPTTEISYKTEGTAPDRKLTVQYKDLQLWVDGWNGIEIRDTVSLQFCLHESGEITMQFYGFEPSAATAEDMNYNDGFKIGILGSGDDRLIKQSSFDGDAFGTGSNAISWRASTFPADGLTYSFLPPEDCEAPAEQASNLVLTATSLCVDGSFTPTSTADHYLVLLNQSESVSTLPEDGTFYAAGDVIGDATVLAYSTDTTFTSGDILSEASEYYIHVLATNSYCFYAPKYNTTSPLTMAVTTAPAAPASVALVEADSTKLTLSIAANANGDDVLVAYTREAKRNFIDQLLPGGTFGEPTNEAYAVGDSIDGGGYVAYVGKASDAITIENLVPGKAYHISAWSKNAAGLVSSTSTTMSTATAGIVPWEADLSGQSDDYAPVGWNHKDNWQLYNDRSTGLTSITLYLSTTDGVNGVETWIETPDVYMSEGKNRLVIDVAAKEWLNRAWSAYSWRDKDTLNVQVTTDGENYTTVASYTKDNPLTFKSADDATKVYIPFLEAAGEKARVRLWGRLFADPQISLSNIHIESVASCDYPINVNVPDSTIIGGDAVVRWAAQGEEDAWDYRYKLSSSETWSDPVTVRSKSATITGLAGVTSYDVQVRAHCSDTEQSVWSETCTFTSGYAVPFSMAFADLSALPDTWGLKKGALATPTVLTDGGGWYFRKTWRAAYMFFTPQGDTSDDWLVTPIIDLGSENVNSIVDIALTPSTEATATDAVLKLVVAADGETFNEADTVLTIKASELPETYESVTYSAPLKNYKGKVRFGLYMHASDGRAPELMLDSLNLRYSCLNDIEAQVDTIGNDTVHVSWTSGADEWLVFCREAGSKACDYKSVTTPEYGVGGLKEFTAYEIGITKTCEPGDTAKVQLIKFTTTGTLCEAPTEISAVANKYSATVTWQGEASVYNVRYRKSSDESAEWILKQVEEAKIEIPNLTDSTEYAIAVQSQCGVEVSDTSAYSETYYFTTLAETCFAPENITVEPTHNKAIVAWEGTADSYALAYKKAADDEWTETVVANGGYTIEGLTPETDYRLRMRSICAEGDSSLWSANVSFTTEAEPECVTPTDLEVSNITYNSALLTWKGDESNLTWNLRYRESSVSAWTEEFDLTETSYQLDDLKENTAYIWRVQATCEEERTSSWASQSRFSTTVNAIDGVGIGDVRVFVQNGMLNIVNPAGGMIQSVKVFDANGRTLMSVRPNTTDNIFVRLNTRGQIIVKVDGQKITKTYKLMAK